MLTHFFNYSTTLDKARLAWESTDLLCSAGVSHLSRDEEGKLIVLIVFNPDYIWPDVFSEPSHD